MALINTGNAKYSFTPNNTNLFKSVEGSLEIDVFTKFIEIPAYSVDHEYNGEVISIISESLLDASKVDISGDISATVAGEYTLVLSLKDPVGYRWNDNSNEDKEIKWRINRKTIEFPYNDKSNYCNFTNDGNEHSPSFTNYDSNIMTINGTTSAVIPGEYIATISLNNDSYQWEDGTTDPIDVAWYIDGIDFTVTADNRADIGYTGTENEELVIPDIFEGSNGLYYKVTSISDNAFKSCTLLKSVSIPQTVTNIGTYAFSGCSALESVEFKGILISAIKGYTFMNCAKLKSITIPNGVKSIAAQAFSNCTGLQSMIVPKTLTTLEPRALYRCTALNTVYYEGSEEDYSKITIGQYNTTFESSTKTYNYEYELSEEYGKYFIINNGQILYFKERNIVNEVKIPSRINEIDVTSIGRYVFDGLSIKSIIIPDTVQTIEMYAFSHNPNLNNIKLGNNVTIIKDNALLESTQSIKELILPNTLISLGNNDFSANTYITSLVFPDNLEKIEGFTDCTSLQSVTFGANTKEVNGFNNCENLTQINFSNGVENIKGFRNCTALESLNIPSSVNTIDGAFVGCSSLSSVNISNIDNLENVLNSSFKNTPWFNDNIKNNKEPFIVSGGHIFYIDWNNIPDRSSITIPEGVKYIASNMFYQNSTLENIIIPESVEYINEFAFYNCTNLKSVVFNNTKLKEISQYAFYGCNALESINIPNTVVKIDKHAFNGCNSLTTVVYDGTKKQWYDINISAISNTNLINAIKLFKTE